MRKRFVGPFVAAALLALGAARFAGAGLLPAVRTLNGDFGASFPTAYFARLRPDFPTDHVWPGWNYGPMLHFLSAPLLLVPRWSMVPMVWALVNAAALMVSFVLVCRLSGVVRQVSWATIATLGGVWLLYQPLANCFAQGNIEIVEMALILAAITTLPRSKGLWSGVLVGVATMTKFLPVGFFCWFLLRRYWRAVWSGLATIVLIVVVTTVTLGWKTSISFRVMTWAAATPIAGFHELSVTSLFLHRAALLDSTVPVVRWFPTARAWTAGDAGALASVLLAFGYSLVLFLRRHRPESPLEVAVLFMTMFMILPWNHDYYYVFGLVALSVLFLRGVALRQWTLLAGVVVAYIMISPPIPFGVVDRLDLFAVPFAYVVNYANVPVIGGLLLWLIATQQMFAESRDESALASRWPSRRFVALGAVAALVAAAFLWLSQDRRPKEASSSVAAVQPPVLLSGPLALALSPDGVSMAYLGSVGSVRSLCVRPLDAPSATCFPETEDAADPFFSPDSRWVGFFSGGKIKKAPVAGGALEVICSVNNGRTASWNLDGTIVFASPGEGIWRVPAAGGSLERLIVARPEDEGDYLSPTFAPSGDSIFFTVARPGGGMGAGTIAAHSLKTGKRVLLLDGSQPHFDAASGQLLYALGARVLAVPFNPDTFALSDLSVPIVADVLVTPDGGAQFAVSDNGALVYAPQGQSPAIRRTLAWVDRRGAAVSVSIPPDAFETPRLSPDGRTVAFAVRGVTTDLWTYDLTTTTVSRLTFDATSNDTPVWMPDSRTVLFAARGIATPRGAVFSAAVDGDRRPTELFGGNPLPRLGSSSADGRFVVGAQGGDLWILGNPLNQEGLPDRASADSRGPVRRVIHVQTPAVERTPVFSPDGRWIAYTSNESRRNEVYVQAFPGLNEWRQVSTDGGEAPAWSPDGRELFYRRGDAMMSVPVTTAPTFTAGQSRELFRGPYLSQSSERHYDVAADGRFLMVTTEAASFRGDVRVVRGWPSMVRR